MVVLLVIHFTEIQERCFYLEIYKTKFVKLVEYPSGAFGRRKNKHKLAFYSVKYLTALRILFLDQI